MSPQVKLVESAKKRRKKPSGGDGGKKANGGGGGGRWGGGRPPTGPGAWNMQLTTGPGGHAKTLHNVVLVLMNDPAWQREVDGETRSIIAYDEFACTTVFVGDPPWEDFYHPQESQGLVQPHAANRRNLRAAKHFAGKEIDDRDAGRAAVWMERNYPGLSPSTGMVLEAFEIVAETQKVHPVREYLHSLKWDGQRRVGTVGSKDDPGAPSWLATLMGAKDSPYVRTVGRWWLISAVARIMSPGEQVDSLIILEGAQGAGKSQGLRALAEPWFSEDLGNIQDTASAQQQIQGVWIIEIAELDAINRSALEAVKKFITQPYDRFRAPYGRRVRQYARQCVFAATTNARDNYLRDTTGNRRYWPVLVGQVKVDEIRSQRDQLWAEALVLYAAAEKWYALPDEAEILREQQDERVEQDPWQQLVVEWISDKRWNTARQAFDPVEIEHVLAGINVPQERWTKAEFMRVGKILQLLGWRRTRMRVEDMRFRSSSKTARSYHYLPPLEGAAPEEEPGPPPNAPLVPPAEPEVQTSLFSSRPDTDDDPEDFDR